MKNTYLNGGWSSFFQILITVFISLSAVWLKEFIGFRKNKGLKNFEKKQEIYTEIFIDLSNAQQILNAINLVAQEYPNSIHRTEKLIERIDALKLNVTFELYGNESMKKSMSAWVEAKEEFLAAISIQIYESKLTDGDRQKFKEYQTRSLKSLNRNFEDLGNQIRKDLNLS